MYRATRDLPARSDNLPASVTLGGTSCSRRRACEHELSLFPNDLLASARLGLGGGRLGHAPRSVIAVWDKHWHWAIPPVAIFEAGVKAGKGVHDRRRPECAISASPRMALRSLRYPKAGCLFFESSSCRLLLKHHVFRKSVSTSHEVRSRFYRHHALKICAYPSGQRQRVIR
jgi:hypothetical protein